MAWSGWAEMIGLIELFGLIGMTGAMFRRSSVLSARGRDYPADRETHAAKYL